MISIHVNRGKSYAICAKGHAGGEQGKDIVCSAVSSLIQNILIGLESLSVDWKCSMEHGNINIVLKRDYNEDLEKAIFLMETTVKSLKEITASYSDRLQVMENSTDEIV